MKSGKLLQHNPLKTIYKLDSISERLAKSNDLHSSISVKIIGDTNVKNTFMINNLYDLMM